MRQAFLHILRYFPAHWRADFKWSYYLAVLLLLGSFTGINYFWLPEVTVERWITNHYYGSVTCMLWYLLFYAVPYYATVGLYVLFFRQYGLWRSRHFWLRSLFGLAVLSFDAGFYWYRPLAELFDGPVAQYIWRKYLSNFYSTLSIGLVLWGYWYWRDRRHLDSFYGLTRRGFDWRPYAVLMALMVPLVITAAFTSDFLAYYPTLKLSIARRYEDLPVWLTMGLYELVYASDFIWTELIFRGFFVIGLARVMGSAAVVPMCSVYAFRHFAKPIGESISSILGGYILGVIALNSRNVWGGVWVHMGIALLMELTAILIKKIL